MIDRSAAGAEASAEGTRMEALQAMTGRVGFGEAYPHPTIADYRGSRVQRQPLAIFRAFYLLFRLVFSLFIDDVEI